MDGYGVFVIDIYSCDHALLVSYRVEHRVSRVVVEREPEVVVSENIFPAPGECDR